jgi:thioredoxin 1
MIKQIRERSEIKWYFFTLRFGSALYLRMRKNNMVNNSKVIVLSSTNFEEEVLKSLKPVVVEFVTEWSGACQIIDPIMKQLMTDFRNRIKFCCIDIEKNKGIAEEYGVRDVPTLLFFKDGQVEDHIIGAVSKKVLTGRLNGLLN